MDNSTRRIVEFVCLKVLCSVSNFLQEHWLAPSQLSLLGNLDDNFVYTGVSGFGNNDVLSGRPSIWWECNIVAL